VVLGAGLGGPPHVARASVGVAEDEVVGVDRNLHLRPSSASDAFTSATWASAMSAMRISSLTAVLRPSTEPSVYRRSSVLSIDAHEGVASIVSTFFTTASLPLPFTAYPSAARAAPITPGSAATIPD